jgi:hypothetical protein
MVCAVASDRVESVSSELAALQKQVQTKDKEKEKLQVRIEKEKDKEKENDGERSYICHHHHLYHWLKALGI